MVLVSRRWVNGCSFRFDSFDQTFLLGVHYWYDNRIDTDCTRFLPAFLLYNRGQLSGFGWDIAKKLEFSRRTEYPPRTALMVRRSILSFSLFASTSSVVVSRSRSNVSTEIVRHRRWFYHDAFVFQRRSGESRMLMTIIFSLKLNWSRTFEQRDSTVREVSFSPCLTRTVRRSLCSVPTFVRALEEAILMSLSHPVGGAE